MVDPTNGQLWAEVTDLAVPGLPEPLAFSRMWDGERWSWTADATLDIQGDGVRLERPGQPDELFPPLSTNPQEPWCAVGLELAGSGGGTLVCIEDGYEVHSADGTLEHFDGLGRLLRRTAPQGEELLLSWTDDGLASIATPDGRRIIVGEAKVVGERLERVARDPSGQQATLGWSDEGRLDQVSVPSGLRHRYLYDDKGRLRTLLWSDGSRATISWDAQGRVESIHGPGQQRWGFSWGPDGLVRATDGRGSPWVVRWDGDAVTVKDPGGRSASLLLEGDRVAGWRDPAGQTTHLIRDLQGRPEGLKDPTGARWAFTLDQRGRPTSISDPLGARWRLDRDQQGLRIVEPTGRSRSLSLDEHGRVVAISDGATILRIRRDSAGLIRELEHGSQGRTRITRDGAGRILAITDAAGGTTRLASHRGQTPGTLTDPGGGVWKLSFDRLGRASGLVTPEGTSVGWTRDSAGRLTKLQHRGGATSIGRRVDGAITRITDPLGRITGWSRDTLGTITAQLRPDGSEARFTRDPRGDLRGILLGDEQLEVERDSRGLPVALTRGDHADALIRWARDLTGRIIGIQWPSGGLELTRDAAGLVRSVQLQEKRWELSRDPGGRLRAVTQGEERWTLQRNDAGLVTALESPDGSVQLRLDPRGLPQQADLFDLSLRWRRDATGLPARIDGPGGASLGVQRDTEGRPVLHRLPNGALLRTSYEERSRRIRLEDANGRALLEAGASSDAAGRLSSVEDERGVRHLRYGPSDELISIEGETSAWSVFPGRREGPPGSVVVRTDERGRPVDAESSLAVPTWGVSRRLLSYELDDDGTVQRIRGEEALVELEHDALGRLLSVAIRGKDDETIASWRVLWDPFGRPRAIDGNGERTDLAFLQGRLLGLRERGRAALLLGEDDATVLAGADGAIALITAPGGARELALFAEGEPYVADSLPGGLRDLGYPGILAEGGRLQLFPGGPLVGPQDAQDPLSGIPTSAWTRLLGSTPSGWPAPEGEVRWPTLDGAATPPWDPSPWGPEGPWADPLALLVALGAIQPPVDETWWTPNGPTAPLPWLPASLDAPPPAPLPVPGSIPLAEPALERLLLASALPPAEPIALDALLSAILEAELAELPQPPPGLPKATFIPW